jgi:acyl-CoA hydrolase
MTKEFQYVRAEEALSVVAPGDRVFVQGSAMTPVYLLNELAKQSGRLRDVELVCITVQGDLDVCRPELAASFRFNSMFVSAALRDAVAEGRADYVPVFLSEIPELFRQGFLPLDVAIVQVSVPDAHGFCSLGVSVDVARSAVDTARHVIAQVNPNVPRTHGDGMVHVSRLHSMVWCEDRLPEVDYAARVTDVERRIGRHIAALVEDGACLQMGIGAIPDAMLACLDGHRDLGVHTEMFSDGLLPLIEKGIVNNSRKHIHPHKTVSGFALGSRRLYDKVHDNPSFQFLDIDYVNDPHVIRRNPKVVAVNSCVEVDLTGQVCSDSIGSLQYSGVGGQMDFMRGASLSDGGKPVIALPSRTHRGQSRIVPFLKPGAGVVTTRAHLHWVVTEFGAVNLFGKNLRQRAAALIALAHPEDREMLERAAHERFRVFPG